MLSVHLSLYAAMENGTYFYISPIPISSPKATPIPMGFMGILFPCTPLPQIQLGSGDRCELSQQGLDGATAEIQ